LFNTQWLAVGQKDRPRFKRLLSLEKKADLIGGRDQMKKRGSVWIGLLISFLFLTPEMVEAEKKITLSRAEEVILYPGEIRLIARIDTGATVTSLDARGLKIDENTAEFRLPEEYGGALLRLPITGWRHVRSSKGRENRPVVEIDLCIASKRLRIKANLNDRSMVKYPLILGRNALKDHFIVDVNKRSKTTPPDCPNR
jgi:hypothetical protein